MSTKGTPSGPDRSGDVLMTDLAAREWAALARHTTVVLTAGTDVPRLGVINGGGAA